MKLFGGKANHRSKPQKKTRKTGRAARNDYGVYTPHDGEADYDVLDGTDAKPKKDKKGRALLIVAIIAFVLAGAAFAATHFIRPPEVRLPQNDATIVDEENGDQVVIDPGERISDYFTFLVCATDIDETRTDNIMLVGFDTKNHKVKVLNIPRDVMCANNRTGASRKINAAYGSKHNIENTKKEVKKVIGFTPDKYIVVNFNGIAEIVDAIGGIDYEVPFKMIYNDPVQDLNIYFEPGMQHMNGEQVVEFLRWRHNDPGYTHLQTKGYDGGDESRIQKQQEFLLHLADQILKPTNILKAKPIAEAVFRNVKTDLTLGEIVWMANQAMAVDTANIEMFTLPGYPASSYAGTDAFLSFFFPNESKTLALINEHFNPYDKPITSLDVISSPPEGTRRAGVTSDEDEPEIAPPAEEPEETGDPEEQGETGDPNGELQTPDGETGEPNGETDAPGGETGDPNGETGEPPVQPEPPAEPDAEGDLPADLPAFDPEA